jgi:hypothetical protein
MITPERHLRRFVRWLAAHGVVHLLLLASVAGCVYPLAWMFLTSVETDEELGQGAAVPSLPRFCGHSPYVRDAVELPRPEGVDTVELARVLPKLTEGATQRTLAALPSRAPTTVDRAEWARSAATALVARALARTPLQELASNTASTPAPTRQP